MANHLANPEFITFLMNRNSSRGDVFIVEDAENVLKSREAGGNEAVANILNASNGILGDVLHTQFIFTLNCQIDQIDPALSRPGRLIDQYEFKTLEEDKTRNLWCKVNPNVETPPKSRMTLAEIFNHESSINPKRESNKIPFGFVSNG